MTRKRTPHSGPFRSQAERDFSNTVERAMTKPKTNRTARILIPVAAGGATLAAGAYLYHRSQKGKKAVTKNLINPFEEVVVYGKAYPVVDTTMGVRTIRALVPTGSHVGHANALVHVRGPRSGGHATKLEHYSGPKSGGKVHGVLRATGGHGGKKAGLERFSGPHSGGKQPGYERFTGPKSGGRKSGLEHYSKAFAMPGAGSFGRGMRKLRAINEEGKAINREGMAARTVGQAWDKADQEAFRARNARNPAPTRSTYDGVGRSLNMIDKMPKPKTAPTGNWKPALQRRLEQGPEVGKGFGGTTGFWSQSNTVGRGLEMVARTPKAKRVAKPPKTAGAARNALAVAGHGNSNIPSGARRGRNLGVS